MFSELRWISVLFLLLLRLTLAAVFAVAAVGKLADRPGTRAAVISFGAPARVAGAIALGLALAELAVAVALLLPGSTVAGALGALLLLALFSVAIAINLARGRRPDCHCFGQVHSEPIGARSLLRNGALAVAAGGIIALAANDPGPNALAWVVSSPGAALAVGLAAGLGVATWIAFRLTRRHGVALRRIDELEAALTVAEVEIPEPATAPVLPIGTPAPAFPGLDGMLAQGRTVLAVFTSEGCGPCRELAPKLARWRRDFAEHVAVAKLSYGDDPGLADRYGVEGTPAAVAIGPSGQVESAVVHGPDAIADLFEETLLESLPAPPDVGEAVLDLPLETLSGDDTRLLSRLSSSGETLLLFWNPGCGFCSAMRDDLRVLEEGARDEHPSLVVISAGAREDTRADAFRSPVLLDPMSLVQSSIGAGGTPTAVLVGPDGRLRSEIAGGRDGVLRLAGVEDEPAPPELEIVMSGAASNGAEG